MKQTAEGCNLAGSPKGLLHFIPLAATIGLTFEAEHQTAGGYWGAVNAAVGRPRVLETQSLYQAPWAQEEFKGPLL